MTELTPPFSGRERGERSDCKGLLAVAFFSSREPCFLLSTLNDYLFHGSTRAGRRFPLRITRTESKGWLPRWITGEIRQYLRGVRLLVQVIEEVVSTDLPPVGRRCSCCRRCDYLGGRAELRRPPLLRVLAGHPRWEPMRKEMRTWNAPTTVSNPIVGQESPARLPVNPIVVNGPVVGIPSEGNSPVFALASSCCTSGVANRGHKVAN